VTARVPVSLADAAAAYCALRDQIDGMRDALRQIGHCQNEDGDSGAWCAADRIFADDDGTLRPWWELTPEQLRDLGWCESCLARIPLWRERHAAKQKLSSRIRTMRAAYRRATR
jgi:hypothetical protein